MNRVCPDCGGTNIRTSRHRGARVWCADCDATLSEEKGRYEFNKVDWQDDGFYETYTVENQLYPTGPDVRRYPRKIMRKDLQGFTGDDRARVGAFLEQYISKDSELNKGMDLRVVYPTIPVRHMMLLPAKEFRGKADILKNPEMVKEYKRLAKVLGIGSGNPLYENHSGEHKISEIGAISERIVHRFQKSPIVKRTRRGIENHSDEGIKGNKMTLANQVNEMFAEGKLLYKTLALKDFTKSKGKFNTTTYKYKNLTIYVQEMFDRMQVTPEIDHPEVTGSFNETSVKGSDHAKAIETILIKLNNLKLAKYVQGFEEAFSEATEKPVPPFKGLPTGSDFYVTQNKPFPKYGTRLVRISNVPENDPNMKYHVELDYRSEPNHLPLTELIFMNTKTKRFGAGYDHPDQFTDPKELDKLMATAFDWETGKINHAVMKKAGFIKDA